jgi:ligand-binding sensor domain-containing protein
MKFIFTFYLISLWNLVLCQYKVPVHFTPSNGLTTESMYSCIVDKDGFIWFASEMGATRFNGHDFEHFKAIEDAANSFLFFKVDKNNRIWANTVAGDINYFQNGKWNVSPQRKFIKQNNLNVISNTLIGTIEDLVVFKYERDVLLVFNRNETIDFKFYKGLLDSLTVHINYFKIENNNLILYTEKGVKSINLDFLRPYDDTPDLGYYFKNGNKVNYIKANKIYEIQLDNIGKINELLSFDSFLYIASSKGLNRFKKVNDTQFLKLDSPILNIPCVSVSIDNQRNLWVCSQLEGVYFYPYVLGESYYNTNLKGDFFLKALPDDNQFDILTTYGKVIKCNNGIFTKVSDFKALSYDIQKIHADNYCLTTKALYKNGKEFYTDEGAWFKSFLIDKEKKEIYIGCGDRLIEAWPNKRIIEKQTVPNRIYGLTTNGSELLMATDNGVQTIQNNKLKTYDLGKHSNLKNIASITISKDSSLFIISKNLGVLIKNKQQYILLRENIDLLEASTCSNSPKNGWVLIGSRNGLNVINYQTNPLRVLRIKSFTNTSGLCEKKINNIDYNPETDNVLLTFNNSIQNVKLSDLLNHFSESKLYFKYISSGNQIHQDFSELQFKNNENNIEIGFGTIDYASISKRGYSYRLIGNSDNWNDINGNVVKFSDLDPGEYIFELKLRNRFAEKNVAIAMKFNIIPSFWQVWWFKVMLLVFAFTLLIWSINFRQNKFIEKVKERNKLEKEHASLELEAIKAQINPHFIYNCLNSIQHSIVMNDSISAEKQLSTFSKLVRETLDYSRVDFIQLKHELAFLNKYLWMENMRFKEKLEYEIESSILNPDAVFIPCMLIQPFVENAIKHGLSQNGSDVSTVKIEFTLVNNRIECRVEDSGVGIDTSKIQQRDIAPSGIGLSMKRVETYNRIYNLDIDVNIKNKKSITLTQSGTLTIINIPLLNKTPVKL